MVRVAPIKLQVGPKVLWFDPTDIDIHAGDNVIVKTERGTEFGTATSEIIEVSDELVEQLKSPLKPVLRVATEEDIAFAEELLARGDEALPVFKELAAETNEDMHPVLVEFLFDGDKAVFYFEAEDRIDFRELVRKLASHFRVRVDMRQIGVRDGARIIGGLGHCGQELCCKRMGGEFSPVSIRMAKEQNLSLNPQKISGVCGRLMCCLRYEYEAYKEVNSRAPKLNAKIEVPDGTAKVIEVNVPREQVSLLLEDGRTIKVPLAEMEIVGDGKRPNKVSEEVFETYANTNALDVFERTMALEVTSFTAEEKLADVNASRKKEEKQTEQPAAHRRPRNRARSNAQAPAQPQTKKTTKTEAAQPKKQHQEAASTEAKKEQPKRTRRSRRDRVTLQSKAAPTKPQNDKRGETSQNNTFARNQNKKRAEVQRPGQKSSGLRNMGNSQTKKTTKPSAANQSLVAPEAMHRKSRRRRHRAGGDPHENG